MATQETGLEPNCAHCGKRSVFALGKGLSSDKNFPKGHVYYCQPCEAYVELAGGGFRALGTPASSSLWRFRESLKRDLDKLVHRWAKAKRITVEECRIKTTQWAAKAVSQPTFDLERMTEDQCKQLDLLLDQYF